MANSLDTLNIEIEPVLRALESHHVSVDQFYEALQESLEKLEGQATQDLPTPPNIPIWFEGHSHPLGELARVSVTLGPEGGTVYL